MRSSVKPSRPGVLLGFLISAWGGLAALSLCIASDGMKNISASPMLLIGGNLA